MMRQETYFVVLWVMVGETARKSCLLSVMNCRKGSQLTMGMVQESIADHDLPAARSRLRDYEARYIESIADESSEAKLLRK